MSFDRTNYNTVLQQCRDALRQGNHVVIDPKMAIACILDAAGSSGQSSLSHTLATAAATLKTTIDTQFGILNAFTGSDAAATIVAAIATANTAIAADEAALETARAASAAQNPTALALAASTTMDG